MNIKKLDEKLDTLLENTENPVADHIKSTLRKHGWDETPGDDDPENTYSHPDYLTDEFHIRHGKTGSVVVDHWDYNKPGGSGYGGYAKRGIKHHQLDDYIKRIS